MKEKFGKIIESVFSITLMIAIIGAVLYLHVYNCIDNGRDSGRILATNASKVVMPYFIRLASIAVLCGFDFILYKGKHTPSLNSEE